MSAQPSSDSPAATLVAEATAARQAGRLVDAAGLFLRALELSPTPDHLLMAAETLYRVGLLRAAHGAMVAARAAAPAHPQIELLLGRVLSALGRRGEAIEALQRALALEESPLALRLLGATLSALGRQSESQDAFARADRLESATPEIYNDLGVSFVSEGRPHEAESVFRRAVAIAPGFAAAHENLGIALAAQDRLREALAAERHALAAAPRSAAAWLNFATFAGAAGQFSLAREGLQRAASLSPDAPNVLTNVAHLKIEEGDARGALGLLDLALKRSPSHRAAIHGRLLARNYVDGGDGWLAEARQLAGRLRPDVPEVTAAPRRASRDRLRVGFVSADFRRHSCASFLAPLFGARDPSAYELFAYSDNPADDAITETLRGAADTWRPIAQLRDSTVAEMIADDGIDVLVDLSGHMAGNRLPLFALKPAPLQVSWLGYPDTTGLDMIDYRLTDAIADPPGEADQRHSERLFRLPGCFLAYGPDPAAPSPEPEPVDAAPVFVSFNHLPKVTPEVVATWSRILALVPGSRLLLKAKRLGEPQTRERYLGQFAAHGIAADRLELLGWRSSPSDHLALYRRAAIALDPFPYNGTTTTCEALWMGVPVITLAGTRHAARVGTSLLTAVGLGELIANSLDDYVNRAVALAQDAVRRSAIRSGLRARMAASPLCDAAGFARRFEAALARMWAERKGG